MKNGQFTEEQILALLQKAERGDSTIQALCREHNVSENTFYRWRSRYGNAAPADAMAARNLSAENARLKRLLAERDLENDILKELLAKK